MLHCSSGLKSVNMCVSVCVLHIQSEGGECKCHYSNLFPVTRKMPGWGVCVCVYLGGLLRSR